MNERHLPYELFALGISVFALIVLGWSTALPLDPETERLLDTADLTLCAFFFGDFLRNLWRAENRLRYFFTWGWIDLAASIPAVDALRAGRLARILRILRVIRVVKAGRMIARAFMVRRRESAAFGGVFTSLLVVFIASVAILEVERGAGGNIVTAEDAVWWSVTTITTVGYGDRYPVTTEGRMVAVGLMIVGVGVFGMISGLAASLFLQPVATPPRVVVDAEAPADRTRES
jgi:voltage-gated potassium channel